MECSTGHSDHLDGNMDGNVVTLPPSRFFRAAGEVPAELEGRLLKTMTYIRVLMEESQQAEEGSGPSSSESNLPSTLKSNPTPASAGPSASSGSSGSASSYSLQTEVTDIRQRRAVNGSTDEGSEDRGLDDASPDDKQSPAQEEGRTPGAVRPVGSRRFHLAPGKATVVIRNIPARCAPEWIMKLWPPAGSYNLLFLPHDATMGRSAGYAFVNFVSHAQAEQFGLRWHGKKLIAKSRAKPLNITCAHTQGYRQTLNMYMLQNPSQSPCQALLLLFTNTGERLPVQEELSRLQ